MTLQTVIALTPWALLALAVLVTVILLSIRRSHLTVALSTLIGLALAGLSVPLTAMAVPIHPGPLLVLDGYAQFYTAFLIAVAFVTCLLGYGYLQDRPGPREEFYALVLIATLGGAILTASAHFASLFLGLETLTISLYTLIAYYRTGRYGLEAGIKYLVLGGASSAALLMGMALLYAHTGALAFTGVTQSLAIPASSSPVLPLTGLALVIAGAGFKLAVVPFHLWTPDVYQGAPAPVTGFVATLSKGAVVAVLYRFIVGLDPNTFNSVFVLIGLLAVLSMFAGNLLALFQDNVKRLLAYSSIAHMGYLLIAVLHASPLGAEAVAYYLVAYSVTTLAAFGVAGILGPAGREAEDLEEYCGLFWSRPAIAAVFTACMLSLAGIPLTAGFIGKFYVIAAGVDAAYWTLVLLLVLNSVIGLFYYLRVVVAMVSTATTTPEPSGANPKRTISPASLMALTLLMLLLVGLGLYPPVLQSILGKTVGSLL